MADLETTPPQAKKPRRTHSFGGCGTCRRRHVKCDQVRPTCLTCKAVAVKCEGYRTDLKWISSNSIPGSGLDNGVTRRHLFSAQSRESMSTSLQSGLASKPIDESLSELDARAKDLPTNTQPVSIGPFGVFELNTKAPPTSFVMSSNVDITNENANTSPTIIESMDSLNYVNDFLDWPDLFDLDFSWPDLNQPNNETLPAINPMLALDTIPEVGFHTPNAPPPQVQWVGNISIQQPVQADIAQRFTFEGIGLNTADIEILLRHYKYNVIPNITALPTCKSPWETLMLQFATQTHAQCSFLGSERVNHAAFTNLLATLAVSARHLSTTGQHQLPSGNTLQNWSQIAIKATTLAKEHLQISLQNETKGPKQAKYKEQLMAILSMLSFAIVYDKQLDARCYMIDAERLLRIRGLAKRTISRRARQLHHLYTWVRIVGESTYVLRDYQKSEINVDVSIKTSTLRKRRRDRQDREGDLSEVPIHNTKLDDFLRLEPSFPEDESGKTVEKEVSVALHDIHLEDSREWSGNLYILLYGISETWLTLVSQTTRLANVMDSLNARRVKKDGQLLEALERRQQRLENLVCAFATNASSSRSNVDAGGATTHNTNNSPLQSCRVHIIKALHSSLVIFFYRRIRNVNPLILQQYVNEVVQALQDFEISRTQGNIPGPGCPWPVFIAGCESISKTQRDFFTNWVNQATTKTGSDRFRTMLSCMQKVWSKRDDLKHNRRLNNNTDKNTPLTAADWNWIQVSKESNIHVIMS